jgi:hypothetical protein
MILSTSNTRPRLACFMLQYRIQLLPVANSSYDKPQATSRIQPHAHAHAPPSPITHRSPGGLPNTTATTTHTQCTQHPLTTDHWPTATATARCTLHPIPKLRAMADDGADRLSSVRAQMADDSTPWHRRRTTDQPLGHPTALHHLQPTTPVLRYKTLHTQRTQYTLHTIHTAHRDRKCQSSGCDCQ